MCDLNGTSVGKTGQHAAIFFMLLCAVLLFCSCMPKVERSVIPNDGALRIVSLVPAVTEILFAIGAGDKVVGVTQYCNYPPEAGTKTSVGGFSGATVSVEQIRVLNPDLVFLSVEMHARIVSLLDDLDIRSFSVEPRNLSQVYETIALIGTITGCVPGAEIVIDEMKNKIALVEERIIGMEKPDVFWILNEDPLMSAGAETFVSEAIKLGGGRNIFEDVREQWPNVSPEQVLLRKPDWIFFGDDMGKWPSFQTPFWRSLSAVKEGRVVMLNADILYRYGPRLADGVDMIANILHGTAVP